MNLVSHLAANARDPDTYKRKRLYISRFYLRNAYSTPFAGMTKIKDVVIPRSGMIRSPRREVVANRSFE